jgi:hypothetical protein
MDQLVINNTLAKLAKEIGNEATVVLYNLITLFPSRIVLLNDSAWMKHQVRDAKLLGDTKKYYELINYLIGLKYIDEAHTKEGTLYKINFEALDQFVPRDTQEYDENTIEEIKITD